MKIIEIICVLSIVLRIVCYLIDSNFNEKMMDLLWIMLNLLILIYLKK